MATWNTVSGAPPKGRWDHITQDVKDAERARLRGLSDSELVACYHDAPNPIFQRLADHQIVMIRRLLNRDELRGGKRL